MRGILIEHSVWAETHNTYLGGPRLALALVPGSSTLVTECAESLELLLLLGDLPWCLGDVGVGESDTGACCLSREVVTLPNRIHLLGSHSQNSVTYGGVALLGLLGVAGEDNEAGLVRLEALDVECLALLAQVSPPVVDDNANTASGLAADASLLELGEGEATAFTDFAVVADSLCADGGAEEVKGADAKGSSLGLAGLTTAELAAGLVEPGAHAQLPILAEMVPGED